MIVHTQTNTDVSIPTTTLAYTWPSIKHTYRPCLMTHYKSESILPCLRSYPMLSRPPLRPALPSRGLGRAVTHGREGRMHNMHIIMSSVASWELNRRKREGKKHRRTSAPVISAAALARSARGSWTPADERRGCIWPRLV